MDIWCRAAEQGRLTALRPLDPGWTQQPATGSAGAAGGRLFQSDPFGHTSGPQELLCPSEATPCWDLKGVLEGGSQEKSP